ncbi:MAG TPA: AbrB/MazE/SpoVT family DNA-binding domain-containing protein [Candidatus Diapherotrites archaeon]|uniref:AbrB/MazE/SpoVT family DNA-binding domain-containing protein n=1 Tax=Candidatus Iainarchaeum sp. TaxID=3101447 RepID=A0A7J4JGW3_9ARCH|nr:AbrB/MazE/SpoVT family DNA-binding domain-containing protein [Candidatus Diapherotrites archaeon]HIH15799.1 AbrB/MazE/SpoVT family DNA-binding domain-containing protein [Candidatus Diapherotrites archaeon]
MGSMTVSSKFQIVIPKEDRRDLEIKVGDKLVTLKKGNILYVIKVGALKDARGSLKGLDIKDLREKHERFD